MVLRFYYIKLGKHTNPCTHLNNSWPANNLISYNFQKIHVVIEPHHNLVEPMPFKIITHIFYY